MRSQVVAAVSQMVDSASVSSGLAGGVGLVAVSAVVVGVVGLVFGLLRHHRKSQAERATGLEQAVEQVVETPNPASTPS